jgi:hypothetical protein
MTRASTAAAQICSPRRRLGFRTKRRYRWSGSGPQLVISPRSASVAPGFMDGPACYHWLLARDQHTSFRRGDGVYGFMPKPATSASDSWRAGRRQRRSFPTSRAGPHCCLSATTPRLLQADRECERYIRYHLSQRRIIQLSQPRIIQSIIPRSRKSPSHQERRADR